jgi:hypothetical protein
MTCILSEVFLACAAPGEIASGRFPLAAIVSVGMNGRREKDLRKKLQEP